MIDCVIGAAIGYQREDVRPFFKSLSMSGFSGRVLVFADKGGAEEAAAWGAEVLPCKSVRTLPHAERFYWIHELITSQELGNVLCLDVRDVFFQKSPVILPSNGLHAFEEDASMTIGSCPYNSEWVKIGYGDLVFDQMKNRNISCVGSFCGDQRSVSKHLTRLVKELRSMQHLTKKPQDQSCHNYILQEGSGMHTVWKNEESPIYTTGYIARETVGIVDGNVVNKSGDAPPVIHQYDRHVNLQNLVYEKYS